MKRRHHPQLCYADYIAMAISRRDASREPGISDRLRRFRLESMRFWATLGVFCARNSGQKGKPQNFA